MPFSDVRNMVDVLIEAEKYGRRKKSHVNDQKTSDSEEDEETRFTLRIPEKLIEEIDIARSNRIGRVSRNQFILEALNCGVQSCCSPIKRINETLEQQTEEEQKEKIEVISEKEKPEKQKATYNLSVAAIEHLEDAWQIMRRVSQSKKFTRSLLVEKALMYFIEDFLYWSESGFSMHRAQRTKTPVHNEEEDD